MLIRKQTMYLNHGTHLKIHLMFFFKKKIIFDISTLKWSENTIKLLI